MEDETNTDRISNEGFVLISTAVYDGKYIIIDGNSAAKLAYATCKLTSTRQVIQARKA